MHWLENGDPIISFSSSITKIVTHINAENIENTFFLIQGSVAYVSVLGREQLNKDGVLCHLFYAKMLVVSVGWLDLHTNDAASVAIVLAVTST